jgi:undecaprenyl-diphosphatase
VFDAIQSFDVYLLYGMRAYQNPALLCLATVVGYIAWKGWLWWGVIIGSWLKGNRTFSAHLAAAIAIATVAGLPLKSIIARPRPDLYSALKFHIPMPELLSTQHSFPSGHTLLAAAFAAVVISYYKDWRGWLAAVFVIAVGLSRVYEAMHWPSDVVGSAILGILAAWAAGVLIRQPRLIALATNMASRLPAPLQRFVLIKPDAKQPAIAREPAVKAGSATNTMRFQAEELSSKK